MDLDVVVVAYRSSALLRRCVESLCAERIAVHVVDNACPEDSAATVADLPLTTVAMHGNAGFGTGCNAGARQGTAPAILFLNPDAHISPEDALRLAEMLRADPSIGAVGPRLVDEAGEEHLSVRRFPRLRSAFAEALFLHHALTRAQWTTESVRHPAPGDAEWLSGAALCVRRSAFEQIGGFDERFFLYSEDTDLCLRLHRAGHRVCFGPAATATHVGGQSAPSPLQERRKLSARLLYAALHEQRLRRVAFRLAYVLHHASRVAPDCLRSRDHARGRLGALAVAVARVSPTHQRA